MLSFAKVSNKLEDNATLKIKECEIVTVLVDELKHILQSLTKTK